MWQGKIVEAIHEIRQRYSEKFNHDLKAIFTDLRKQQAESDRQIVTLSRPEGITTHWNGRIKDITSSEKISVAAQLSRFMRLLQLRRCRQLSEIQNIAEVRQRYLSDLPLWVLSRRAT